MLAKTAKNIQFLSAQSPRQLAQVLGLEYSSLCYILYSKAIPRYTQFQISKRRGGTREISSPVGPLKSVQRSLNLILQNIYAERVRPSVHGFVPGRSILSNARSHLGKEWILNVDLDDFFGTINFGRVRGLFLAWPFNLPDKVATVLAQICCNDNKLPQGAPTSPIISNLVCSRLDAELSRLVGSNRCVYTRYADDITVSTSLKAFPRKFATIDRSGHTQLGPDVERIISQNGFVVNAKKLRLKSSEQRLEVTGLIVNQKLNVSRTLIRQIRAMIHAWERFGTDKAQLTHETVYRSFKHRAPSRPPVSFPDVVIGKLAFVGSVRGQSDSLYAKLVSRGRLFADDFFKLPIPEDGVWVLVNNSLSNAKTAGRQGTAFNLAGVDGIVTCWHALSNGAHVQRSDRRPGQFPIHLVRGHREFDIAILKVDPKPKFEFKVGDDTKVLTGDKLTVIGFPNWTPGQSPHFQSVTVAGRSVRFQTNRIVVSETLVGGMSGGPALNANGEVVGFVLTGVAGAKGGKDVGNHIQPISTLLQLSQASDADCSWQYDDEIKAANR